MSGAETARRRVVQRRVGGAETAAPKLPSPSIMRILFFITTGLAKFSNSRLRKQFLVFKSVADAQCSHKVSSVQLLISLYRILSCMSIDPQ